MVPQFFTRYRQSFFVATVGVLLFIIVHNFYNYDFIRKNVEDSAFDYFATQFLSQKSERVANTPNLFVFQVDKRYLKANDFLSSEGKINYGYLYPRDLIASFISKLDKKVAKLQTKPKALFIDYDVSFSSMPYGKEPSTEDLALLEALKTPRAYTIFLPKTLGENFFEKRLTKEIQEGRVVFASVGFYADSDGYFRRFQPIDAHKPSHVALMLYKMANPDANISVFKAIEVVENKIIIKANQSSNNYITSSYWENLKFLSAYDIDNLVDESLEGAIMMFGADHSESMDSFQSKTGEVSGVALHANTLMTLLYLDGKLKQLPLFIAVFIVFIVAFLSNIAMDKISERFGIEAVGTQFLILILILSTVMLSISYAIFVLFKLWFNWFIPLVVLQLHKDWEMLSQIFNFYKLNMRHKVRKVVGIMLRIGFKK